MRADPRPTCRVGADRRVGPCIDRDDAGHAPDELSGDARLVSYVINHRPLPPFDRAQPLVVALVELAEAPRMLDNVVGVPPEPESLPLDLPLRVTFVERGEYALPVFAPAEESAS